MKNWLIFKIVGNIYSYFHCYRFTVKCPPLKHIVAETIRDHLHDKKLGIATCMDQHFFRNIESSNKARYSYQPTKYSLLKKLNASISLSHEDILVDIGSGKGRVVCFFASQKVRKIIGLERSSALSNIAENNLKQLKLNNTEIELYNVDATSFVFTDETIFFIFYPFRQEIMRTVL
jgi:predicted O-methyltransferase YrrM